MHCQSNKAQAHIPNGCIAPIRAWVLTVPQYNGSQLWVPLNWHNLVTNCCWSHYKMRKAPIGAISTSRVNKIWCPLPLPVPQHLKVSKFGWHQNCKCWVLTGYPTFIVEDCWWTVAMFSLCLAHEAEWSRVVIMSWVGCQDWERITEKRLSCCWLHSDWRLLGLCCQYKARSLSRKLMLFVLWSEVVEQAAHLQTEDWKYFALEKICQMLVRNLWQLTRISLISFRIQKRGIQKRSQQELPLNISIGFPLRLTVTFDAHGLMGQGCQNQSRDLRKSQFCNCCNPSISFSMWGTILFCSHVCQMPHQFPSGSWMTVFIHWCYHHFLSRDLKQQLSTVALPYWMALQCLNGSRYNEKVSDDITPS